jgi:hypothetical protein
MSEIDFCAACHTKRVHKYINKSTLGLVRVTVATHSLFYCVSFDSLYHFLVVDPRKAQQNSSQVSLARRFCSSCAPTSRRKSLALAQQQKNGAQRTEINSRAIFHSREISSRCCRRRAFILCTQSAMYADIFFSMTLLCVCTYLPSGFAPSHKMRC